MIKGGIAHPFVLIPWMILVHSRSPCCTVFDRPRFSEPVIIAPVDTTPIMKPDSSKFVGAFIQDAILGFGILHKTDPALYNLRIFALSSSIVILPNKLDFELWPTLDERAGPVLANRRLVALSEHRIDYTLHIRKPGRISSLIQLQSRLKFAFSSALVSSTGLGVQSRREGAFSCRS